MAKDLFRIYRSSAGSGKTYHLTLEYLMLALRSPGYYRKILAVTFTNKATNEMKARIIANLHSIAHNKAPDELVERLCRELNIQPPVLREKAGLTLRSILHGYSYYTVSTIDSFFKRIVTAFARDIGIQGGFTIEFEQDKVTEEIIDRMFLDLEKDHLLREWLLRYTGSRMEEEGRWDIRNELKDLTRQIYYEQFQEYLSVFGDRISDKQLLTDLLDKLKKERAVFNRKLREYGKEGLRYLERYDLIVEDFSYGERGPAGLLQKMALERPFGLNTYMMKAYGSEDSWYTNKSKVKSAILEALGNGLYELYREAIDYYQRHIRYQNTISLVLKLFYNIGIYSNLIQKLVEYRSENAAILISDLSRLIRTVIGENDAPFIYEKIGNYYNHFLIDEFQDTSGFQWNNFKPLIRNTMAQGYFNMLVGDVKQSIYRWRGGDWQILQQSVTDDIGKEYIDFQVLNNNWRSRENIVDFNNRIFRKVPGLLSEHFISQITDDPDPDYRKKLESYSTRFIDSYSDVLQHIPEGRGNKHGGEISVRFFSSDSKEEEEPRSWRDKVLDDLIPLIRHIQDKNYQARQIAVLVRSNREGKMVADHLLEYKRSMDTTDRCIFDVVSSESLFLYASPAVNAVISFMKLIRESKDPVARINLYYWLSVLKGRPAGITLTELYRQALDPDREIFLNGHLLDSKDPLRLDQYMAVALDDLVEMVSLLMELGEFPVEQPYLMGLQNVILDYISVHNGDLNSFLDWWDTDGRNRSINPSEEQNAIQILTIHQAKGLEFDQVIIPFCTWNLDHKPNSTVLWCLSGLESLKDLPYYPVKYEQSLKDSYFIDDYYDEKSLAYMDNVNLLYVALTRAVSGLYVYSELPKNTSPVNHAGSLLYKILNEAPVDTSGNNGSGILADGWDEEKKIFRLGEMPSGEAQAKAEEKFIQKKYSRGRWYEKIAVRKQPDVLAAGDRDEHINYGVMMHDILSRIIHKDQAGRVLEEDLLSGKITDASKKKTEDLLKSLWENKKIENWFSGEWQVKTEVPVLPGSGRVSRMDRVMIKGDQAVVVDYKTGEPVSHDEEQVVRYKKILREMGFKKVEGYLLYLENGTLNSV